MQLKPDHDLPGSAIAALEAVVLDDIVMPKVPVKSALFVAGKGEPNRNIRPYQCHGCAKLAAPSLLLRFRGLDPSDQKGRQNRCRSRQSFERIARDRASGASPRPVASRPHPRGFQQHGTFSNRRGLGLYAALALFVCGLPATAAPERFGQWSLDRPGDFIFALSSKRTISFDDRTATSELAFVCNQENKHVAVLLIPLDATFTSRHKATPVTIQKIEDQSGPSDVMQRWENGPGYILLESPDEQEEMESRSSLRLPLSDR
jgi:hypothetical protein